MHALKVTKPDHIRHIFSKQKLKVSDAYQANKDMACPSCRETVRPTIIIADSDLSNVFCYQISECPVCQKQNWYVVVK